MSDERGFGEQSTLAAGDDGIEATPEPALAADVATSLNNRGGVAYSQGKLDEGRARYERALAIHENTLGPDHPKVATSLTGLGETLLSLAKPADALPLLERALTLRTTHDVDPTPLAYTRFALARALWTAPTNQGRDRARAHPLAWV